MTWTYKCGRCSSTVYIKPGPSHYWQLKQHVIKWHGYNDKLSNHTFFKLLKNYFTGDPVWVEQ